MLLRIPWEAEFIVMQQALEKVDTFAGYSNYNI